MPVNVSTILSNNIVGYTGSRGDTGFTGSQGVIGYTGSEGNNAGLRYNFSTTTTDADPGQGVFRFNNATIASVTQIYIDLANVSGVDFTAFIDTWDDSTNPVKGIIYIDSNTNNDTTKAVFQLNSITTATGYRKLNVTYVSGSVPSNSEACTILFARSGDTGYTGSKGDIGYTGSRGVTGFTGSQGVGSVGGGTDKVFFQNDQTVTTSYTISTGQNAMSTGPLTINSGVTVTVPDGGRWIIL